ncbi:hypothetical protein [Nonomuraea sp. NPDC050643]|uniref:hypothetical protein n=1 Tax=Nonomuraea sp. NPDC050643 TaxID=3155660 RepID=UPI00340B0525
MASWTSRYRSGEHIAVWNDLRAFGATGVPDHLRDDAEEVARETMHRVSANLDLLVDHLSSAKYAFAHPAEIRHPPSADDLEALAKSETVTGPLPLAVRTCLEIAGSVDLCGDGDPLLPHVRYHTPPLPSGDLYPDPLVLHPGQMLWNQLNSSVGDLSLGCACTDPEEDEQCGFHARGFAFSIAPDEAAKANFSGGSHDIHLPTANPDPQLTGVAVTASISFVEYLRLSFSWGGFPGYSVRPAHVPAPPFLEQLANRLLKF